MPTWQGNVKEWRGNWKGVWYGMVWQPLPAGGWGINEGGEGRGGSRTRTL